MRTRQLMTVAWLVLCASCGKDTSATPKPPSKQDDLARIEKAKKGACARDSWKANSAVLQTGSPDYTEVVAAITAAKDHGFGSDLGAITAIPDIAKEVEAVQKDLPAEPPAKPDKPTYEKPKYSGAWPISGLCRGRYENDQGIVIQANGNYYVVKAMRDAIRQRLRREHGRNRHPSARSRWPRCDCRGPQGSRDLRG